MEVREIVLLNTIKAYSFESGYHSENFLRSLTAPKTYNLGECGLVFFEDNVWIGFKEGLKVKLRLQALTLLFRAKKQMFGLKIILHTPQIPKTMDLCLLVRTMF